MQPVQTACLLFCFGLQPQLVLIRLPPVYNGSRAYRTEQLSAAPVGDTV